MAFLPGRRQPADAAPDDGFAAAIVPVDSAEHFTAFAANDNLGGAVVYKRVEHGQFSWPRSSSELYELSIEHFIAECRAYR